MSKSQNDHAKTSIGLGYSHPIPKTPAFSQICQMLFIFTVDWYVHTNVTSTMSQLAIMWTT